MYICLHYSLHGYFFIKLQAHFYTTVNQCVNKSIRQRTTEASKIRPFSTKGIRPSVELQDNSCFLFCFVQSLEDNFTKLCCAKRVETKANGNYHRKIIQRLPNTNGSFVLALDFRHRQHTFFIYSSYHRVEFRGGNMKYIHQLSLTHPQVLQVGRNGKYPISVHSDSCPFHAIPPITGKCPLIRLSKTEISWSSLLLVTLAYICVVVIFV